MAQFIKNMDHVEKKSLKCTTCQAYVGDFSVRFALVKPVYIDKPMKCIKQTCSSCIIMVNNPHFLTEQSNNGSL